MRKTSDETPQFLNLIGLTCQLWDQDRISGHKIKRIAQKKKYMKRHYVKPGITETCRVSGFRGEIKRDQDMINRIKLDVLY
jgi:putative colanic acid biosynthesis UDP-glucose lipid carrier transferase